MQFQFQNFSEFMSMAGHGPYVWASYGITLLCLLYLVAAPVLKRRQLLAELRRQQRIARHEAGLHGKLSD